MNNIAQKAISFLQNLVNQPLCYGAKFPDIDLYDFGFGQLFESSSSKLEKQLICTCTLHVTCRFKIVWKNGEHRVDRYYEDSPAERFRADIQKLIGLSVKRVSLSEKNDLWLDLGDFWIVIATYENGEESWRFFVSNKDEPHLVASDSLLYFVK